MNKKALWQMIKYTLFSLSAGLIQEGSFSLLYNVALNKEAKFWSLCYIIGLALSVLWNFTLNRKFTFKAVVNVPVAMLKVAAFYLVFAPVSLKVGQVGANAGWNGDLVNLLVMTSNFILEFLYFKFVVFRGKDEKKQK